MPTLICIMSGNKNIYLRFFFCILWKFTPSHTKTRRLEQDSRFLWGKPCTRFNAAIKDILHLKAHSLKTERLLSGSVTSDKHLFQPIFRCLRATQCNTVAIIIVITLSSWSNTLSAKEKCRYFSTLRRSTIRYIFFIPVRHLWLQDKRSPRCDPADASDFQIGGIPQQLYSHTSRQTNLQKKGKLKKKRFNLKNAELA